MSPLITSYIALAAAICLEVTGSAFIQKSEQFTKLVPSIITIICFIGAFYLLAVSLKVIPLGVAYAIWAGVGITLTALVSVFIFGMKLDFAAIAGILFIIIGVIIMNIFSNSITH